MEADKDVGRDVKKTGIIIVTVIFLVLAIGFLLVSWMSAPQSVSKINVDKAAGGSGKATQETPRYHKILRENNEAGAKQAQAVNSSFIASIGSGTVRQVPPIAATPAPPPVPKQVQEAQYAPQQHVPQQSLDPDRKKALEALLKELVAQRVAPTGELASIAGNMTVTAGAQSGNAGESRNVNAYSGWTESLAPVTVQPASYNSGQNANRVLIPAGSRPGAVIDTELDSDNTNSDVLAHIPAGPYKGAQLMARGIQLAGDGVKIHFNQMTWNGDTWRVDISAAMPDTLRSSVASSVSNRYGSRVLLPAIAHGLGLGGQLYASANTQVLSNGYNQIEGRVGMPNGEAIAGTILGGTAQQAGQVMANDAQKLPVKQVIVDRGQPVALLFMSAVTENDRITNSTPISTNTGTRQPSAGSLLPAVQP
ncbi:conjugal transfer protein TraO [Pectobacterium carotovorum]|uniref:conjugal transfer protein TraO n=1 Tax=Pectobacterium carotovorum TaxID=554 RepID=UPI0029DDB5BF|nr:conjugal transfer protein TraO [Pectobacterium carotovorum]MDX6917820.1 conjugal transfer protein TraO [Pectobacterium carotovorum]